MDYEVYRTIVVKGFDFVTFCGGASHVLAATKMPRETAFQKSSRELAFPGHQLAIGLQGELQHGDVSMPIDKVRILNVMVNSPLDQLDNDSVLKRLETHEPAELYARDMEYYDRANNALHAQYALKAWPSALANGSVADFHGFDLASTVRQDRHLKTIKLDFTCCCELNDTELLRLGTVFTPQLECLHLGLDSCHNISDAGVSQLKLPFDLTDVKLSLSNLRVAEATWISFFQDNFPKAATSINLEMTSRQADDGSGHMAADYGNQLLMAIADCFCPNLLRFDFECNHGFPEADDAGYIDFASKLPEGLRRLHIELGNAKTPSENNSLLIEFVEASPNSIQDLEIVCKGHWAEHQHLADMWDVLKTWPELRALAFSQVCTQEPHMLQVQEWSLSDFQKEFGT